MKIFKLTHYPCSGLRVDKFKMGSFRSSCSANLFRPFLCRLRSCLWRSEEYPLGYLVHELFLLDNREG